MTAHARRTAAAAALATLLLTTACGGSDDGGDGAIQGADQGESASEETDADDADGDEDGASEDEAPDDGRPEIVLPDDVEMVFDWETPEDPEEAAAVADAADYIRAITLAITEQDPDHPVYQGFSMEGARSYGEAQVNGWIDGGWTKSGSDLYYDLDVDNRGDVMGVEFCRDNSEMHSKEVDTGEVLPKTDEGEFDQYGRFTIILTKAVGSENAWIAQQTNVEYPAESCVR